MRKRFIAPEEGPAEVDSEDWLDIERVAEVEISSEDDAYPIESALAAGGGPGWRAAAGGEQVVRLVFDEPRPVSHVRLVFEADEPRTQEFVLRWAPEVGAPAREIVRQQWNFHPPEGAREVEDYSVALPGVKVLELAVTPDVGGGPARASLRSLRVAG